MELVRVQGLCASSACPTVYETVQGDIAVQGYVVAQPSDGGVPRGEAVVRVPRELIIQAARELAREESRQKVSDFFGRKHDLAVKENSQVSAVAVAEKERTQEPLVEPAPTPDHEEVVEQGRRRLADAEVYAQLREEGFSGPLYAEYEKGLARYGFQVIRKWIIDGKIYARCAARGIVGVYPPEEPETWQKEDVDDLVQNTVGHALMTFHRDALVGGGWQPDGRASIPTYFIGSCLFSFRRAYREYRRYRDPRSIPTDPATCCEMVAQPEGIDSAEWRIMVEDLLASIDDVRLRTILRLKMEGYSYKEISALLADGTTVRAIEGRIRRFRKNEQALRKLTGD